MKPNEKRMKNEMNEKLIKSYKIYSLFLQMFLSFMEIFILKTTIREF